MEETMDYEQEHPEAPASGVGFMMGFLAGAVIGAGIGLLCAPRKGSELREQVSDAAANLGKTVTKTADDFMERGRQVYGRVRDVASRAGTEAERAASSVAQSASSIVQSASEGIDAVQDLGERAARQVGYRP
jgi:gas vesicle protein